jgi:uncharacterized membrane protein HdeD (DUF308 family)
MSSRILWIIMGALSILAGILALANPLAATLTAVTLAGWAFLLIGVLDLFAAFRGQEEGSKFWAICVGIAFILMGILLLARPLHGVVSLTLAVAILFLVTGAFKVVWSFQLRGSSAFWMVLLSGIVSMLLAFMIFSNFPASAATILGVLLAVELISSGISMIALSSVIAADRRASRA